MFGYYVKNIKGLPHVIHSDSGCSLPYRERISKYNKISIPDYKKDLFRDWFRMHAAMRKQIKKETLTLSSTLEWTGIHWVVNDTPTPTTSTDDLYLAKECLLVNSVPMHKYAVKAPTPTYDQDEDEDMYIDNCNDQDTSARNYLYGRMEHLHNRKTNALQKTFGLLDDERPITAKDLIDRITSGKYVVAPDKMEKLEYDPLVRFRWRDPNTKEDRAGFDAAIDTMRTAKTEVEDAIMIKTPTEALIAVKAFENTTFH